MDHTHYSIGKFAELSGIPIRTLHYYEEAGLLAPSRQDNGHRSYGTADLITLQKIIGLKSLGFSLERIRLFLHDRESEMSLDETLRLQQQALLASRAELDKSLETLGRLLAILKRDGQLEHEMMFLLIRNMLREDKQRSWVAEHLSEQTAANLFDISADATAELDREMLAFVDAVKRLSVGAPDAAEATNMIGHYVQRVLGLLDSQAIVNFAEIPEEQHERLNQLVDLPFDERETAWLDQALAHYAEQYGLPGLDEQKTSNHKPEEEQI
ncbi:MerR family transcriptional regulator [Paenibacillus sp. 598K]|uniref:MerR family transcriptional regulator n=1 Tax=Paenibacillus sp. 598K TaxID=1117987 RepID=UPI000FF9870E|nr:MerR family transcriptional regulator [Paenibacillus sp. 598K]GBF77759.1 MerR family transcriptional regulator [Paenibacillus sp. 598K]